MTGDRTITNYDGTTTVIKKEEKWKLLADCIRSGQVETRELLQEFDKDPEFKAWYTAQFLQD